jgi:hypothetical protein
MSAGTTHAASEPARSLTALRAAQRGDTSPLRQSYDGGPWPSAMPCESRSGTAGGCHRSWVCPVLAGDRVAGDVPTLTPASSRSQVASNERKGACDRPTPRRLQRQGRHRHRRRIGHRARRCPCLRPRRRPCARCRAPRGRPGGNRHRTPGNRPAFRRRVRPRCARESGRRCHRPVGTPGRTGQQRRCHQDDAAGGDHRRGVSSVCSTSTSPRRACSPVPPCLTCSRPRGRSSTSPAPMATGPSPAPPTTRRRRPRWNSSPVAGRWNWPPTVSASTLWLPGPPRARPWPRQGCPRRPSNSSNRTRPPVSLSAAVANPPRSPRGSCV